MQIKTIKATTMKEALEKMKNELGPNATVLQTRKYKSGGIMGVGGKEMIEITAAVEDEDEPSPPPAQPQPIQPQPATIQNKIESQPIQQPIQQTQPQPRPIPQQPIQPQTQPTVRPRPKISLRVPTKSTAQTQPVQQPIQQTQPRPIPQTQQPQTQQPIPQPQPKKLTVQPKIQLKPQTQQTQPTQSVQPTPQPIQTPQPIPQPIEKVEPPIPEAVPEEKIERIEVTVNGAIQDDNIPDVTEMNQNQDQTQDQELDQNPDQDQDTFEDEEPEEVESVEQSQSTEEIDSAPKEIQNIESESKSEEKIESESKPEELSKPEEKIESTLEESQSKTDEKSEEPSESKEDQPSEKIDSKPDEKIESKVESKAEEKSESKPEDKTEKKSSDIQILKTSTPLKMPDADLIGSLLPSFRSLEKIPRPKPIPTKNLQIVAKSDEPSKSNEDQADKKDQPVDSKSNESKPAEIKESAESSQDQKRIQELEKEIARMKSLLEQFMGVEEQKDQFISLQEALQNQDIDENIIKEFETSAKPGILDVDNRSDEAKQSLSKFMSQILKFSQGIRLNKNGVRIAALIGPTGVGKTTTLAKIAAKFVLEKNANVALITADTYRISAVEQLKTYADILGLPLETVYTPMELARAIRKHSDKKLILIDTAGRSQFNRVQMRELQDFLKISPHIERHLVLSATTRPRDANDIIEKFSACMPNRLVVTKTDETSSTGSLLNLLRSKNIPLSYITHGQSVPDDILPASAEVFADVLLGRIRNDDFDDQGI